MRAALRAFGEVRVTAGVVVLLFLAYLVWGTAWQASQHQHSFARELQREWAAPARGGRPFAVSFHLELGHPFAFLRILRFGRHWRFAIVQGTGLPQLSLGPGHVPGTALPGRPGNFAVAAHRVTAGNPFYHLNDLRPGDKVLVETARVTFVYQVTRSQLVLPDDTAVLDAVPGHPRQRPRQAQRQRVADSRCPLVDRVQRGRGDDDRVGSGQDVRVARVLVFAADRVAR